jgi:predicted ATPase/trans-aconitate methyltransferase
MKNYEDFTYGDLIADQYDDLYADFDPASIDLLAELAGDGPALELGIGTGRIALPLLERGVTVHGIDASESMVAKMRAKPHGDEIEVLMGSFADFELGQRFNLIYVVFNTFFALLTQEEQVGSFKSVREHLSDNGVFLIEAFVPDLTRFIDHQTVRVVNQVQDSTHLEATQHDPVAQQVTSHHITLSTDGTRLYPVKLRYAWPSELDLMAQLAGLALRRRWGSWTKEEFTKESKKHISHTNWHVITGAPCSGKTTMINELSERGYKTVHEGARQYFESEMAKGRSLEDIRNDAILQQEIFTLQLTLESQLSPDDNTFLDRGLLDSLTFHRVFGYDPNGILPECFHYRYASVFILDPLPNLRNIKLGPEDEKSAVFFDEWHMRDYKSVGYDVIRVPVLPIDDRVEFILENLSLKGLP